MKSIAKDWGLNTLSGPKIDDLRKTITKTSVKSCLELIDKALIK